jgi:superfamily I DNA and/or RNA helicase
MLESLIKGIPARLRQTPTTISEGFNPDELKHRRTILTYQHRMHPDISQFPREQYYKKEGALLDLETPKPIIQLRQWNYSRYVKRSVWIDVKGKTTKNYNLDEADKMIEELKAFLEYASKNDQPEGKDWTVACLTFYKGQEAKIRERLQKLTGKEYGYSNFEIKENNRKINIKLHSVDKFQGQEADIVFLSMVQTFRDGFLDNPNRLNVAITRAKFQLVIIGNHEYFSKQSKSDDLKNLASNINV